MKNVRFHRCFVPLICLATLVSLSCEVGPDYKRPTVPSPTTYKSPDTQATTAPSLRQDWWVLFNDPDLTALETSATQANFDIHAAMQRVVQAREAAAVAGAGFFPIITADPQVTRSRSPLGSGGNNRTTSIATGTGAQARTGNFSQVPFDLSYELDIWGRVRRSYEAAGAQVQATADDLAVVQQTITADLAQDYFTLRSLDAQDQIITRNVELYRKQLQLTESQAKAGLVGQTDVLQARTLLDSTLSQQKDIRRQRIDQEHAIAILMGKSPGDLTVRSLPLDAVPPPIPAGLPADLLRQRPDVAEAEQNLIAANAQIGVAKANLLPNIQLTASGGWETTDVRSTFDWSNRFWSIGPTATIPIFEGDRLTAQLRQARARYEELVATYRGTVIGAFRDVEDSLTDLHFRADQAEAENRAVASAREAARLAEIQYRQGLTSYLLVIDADRTQLTNELSAAQITQQRMISAVLLIKALGGGWRADAPATQPATLTR